jgi:hypothetical protein
MAAVRGVPIISADQLPIDERPAHYILDGAIGLDQVQVSSDAEDTLTLTLTWQSLQTVPYDATTFVHLSGANGEPLVQVDRQPLNGRFPTSYWLPGQVITDVVRLPPLARAFDGPLTLHIGMYTWPSLERLPLVDASGTPQRDEVAAIQISLPPPDEEVIIP